MKSIDPHFKSNYEAVRKRTEALCVPLSVEDYVPQIFEFASPPKWHLAHTSWFFEEMLLKAYLEGYQEFDPVFNTLFNSYYQSVGLPYARNQRGVITRPGVNQVYEYRRHVDRNMAHLFEKRLAPELQQNVQDLIILGCHHEQQHQELLITDLKILLAANPSLPVYDERFEERHSAANTEEKSWLHFEACDATIGYTESGFCYDNELAAHRVHVPAFSIQNQLISNAEYMEFMQADGYHNFNHWFDEAWAWLEESKVAHPLYWFKEQDDWYHFTLAGKKKVDPQAPLTHISYYEASAYANWKGCRLPTEFEWEVSADHFHWGDRWEWTSSAYQAYPGFTIREGAVGEYNGKFMVNQMVLRGASVATAPNHSRKTYRNFFHPYHQWQYTGLRLAK